MPLDQPDEYENTDDPDAYREADDTGSFWSSSNDQTMPLGDHLEELRSRIIKMIIGVVVALVVTVIYGFQIIGWLAQPLLHVQSMLGVPAQPIQTDPTAGFTSVFMRVVFIAALILSAPWLIWQAWQFIVVGLYDHEKKAVHILAPFTSIMTILAVAFTYYILLPVSLAFFINFVTLYPEFKADSKPSQVTSWMLKPYMPEAGTNRPADFKFDTEPMNLPTLEFAPKKPTEGDIWINADRNGRIEVFVDGDVHVVDQRSTNLITPLPAMNEYIKFATLMMLGSVIAFQLPVVMLVLGWAQLFDPRGIASLRKYALFISFALGAILTPADPISMIVLAVPLYLLFEFGLLLMNLTFKKNDDDAMPSDL